MEVTPFLCALKQRVQRSGFVDQDHQTEMKIIEHKKEIA